MKLKDLDIKELRFVCKKLIKLHKQESIESSILKGGTDDS